MGILCLHGIGTNSKVLEMQTSAFRHQLSHSQSHKYEYVDGAEPTLLALDIESFIEVDKSFVYYDPNSAKSIRTAIDDLWEYIAEEGPFDGVLGFS
ncbi:DUF341 domain-containing protein [Fusarium heterosporum]|uniref:DUF341 domain-containing protein n=1 Tax=Fusarium heterosporum TaxID=42747 RepID=A0A8H5WVD6_FUSHE|nr:DUF341 domain-containing protein [Fusarium heterosporum]